MSDARSRSHYLEARVSTASQPDLQVMLLDGALRFGKQAQAAWEAPEQRVESDRLLLRAMEILEELVRSACNGKADVSKRLEEEYAFIYRTLASARFERDRKQLDAALGILEFERETWRQTIDALRGSETGPPTSAAPGSDSAPAMPPAMPAPHAFRGGRFSGADLVPGPTMSLQA